MFPAECFNAYKNGKLVAEKQKEPWAVVLAEFLTESLSQPANPRYRKVHQPSEKAEPTAAGAEAKAAGGHAGGDEPGGAAGSCQVEEHP